MARRDGMPRLELISLHLASGAGCSTRPLLMMTPRGKFYRPQFALTVQGQLCVPGASPAQIETHVVLSHRPSAPEHRDRPQCDIAHQPDLGHVPSIGERFCDDRELAPA